MSEQPRRTGPDSARAPHHEVRQTPVTVSGDADALVECVPNFSEGRDPAKVAAIVDAITSVPGVRLLGVESVHAANRTVVTFLGAPEVVEEAAFRGARAASEVIDMRVQAGVHPRMGATDVLPFIPIRGIDLDGCADLARRVGARVGAELEIPVYLYEHAASARHRRNLADVRRGEYEGLAAKVAQPEWAPDYGPRSANEAAGALITGARPFLIAYNIGLNTRDRALATAIAEEVRESGRVAGGVRKQGALQKVKAIGWFVPEYDRAQVSLNLVDYHVTPPHVAMEAVRRAAAARGLVVTGSELVGLIPFDALYAAGRYYLERQGARGPWSDEDVLRTAVQSLGLNDVVPFDLNTKVLGWGGVRLTVSPRAVVPGRAGTVRPISSISGTATNCWASAPAPGRGHPAGPGAGRGHAAGSTAPIPGNSTPSRGSATGAPAAGPGNPARSTSPTSTHPAPTGLDGGSAGLEGDGV